MQTHGMEPVPAFSILYGPENRYVGFELYYSKTDYAVYNSISKLITYEGAYSGIKEGYLIPYVDQNISIKVFDYQPQYSEKVEVNFYWGTGDVISPYVVDMSRSLLLVYSDDIDHPIQIFRGEINPEKGELLKTIEIDTYRDCFIYLKGSYGSSELSAVALREGSDVEYYDPVSYHFMVTKPCNITIYG